MSSDGTTRVCTDIQDKEHIDFGTPCQKEPLTAVRRVVRRRKGDSHAFSAFRGKGWRGQDYKKAFTGLPPFHSVLGGRDALVLD